MPKFERHLFVCCNEREPGHPRGCCSAKGGELILEAFKAALQVRSLKGRVRANRAGCLDQCEHGVNIVVYPEQTWYGFVKLEDVNEIVEKHIIGGEPVQRLVMPDTCINTAWCPHKGGGAVSLGGLRPK